MLLSITFLLILVSQNQACQQKAFPSGLVCVCNGYTCDTVPNVAKLGEKDIQFLFTTPKWPGITAINTSFGAQQDPFATQISVNSERTFQRIIGFGGGLTDAAGINIEKLSINLQNKLLSSYFGDDGIEYNLCRVPMGACDFSPRMYTMDDNDGDVTLEKFALQKEDLDYKIPIIQRASALRRNKQLNLITTAWTAPIWMKDNQVWSGGSSLKPEYYQTWANYHIKFFDEYLKQGVKFWGMSLGNEPGLGFMYGPIPSMGWDVQSQIKYITENLGPTLRNSSHKDLKLMVHEESIMTLPFLGNYLLNNDHVLKYIDGVAIHWYQDGNYQPWLKQLAFTDKKSTFVLETETCHYVAPDVGSWTRAAEYIDNIMTNLEWNYSGWIEWNLALNSDGGPNQVNNPGDAPIILSADYSEFYKQPTFYAIGHFSKYILPDSIRISTTQDNNNVRTLAFIRPDGVKVVTVYNPDDKRVVSIQINDGSRLSSTMDLQPQSINTILYKV